jgi:lipopolysaccharide export system protein LptC
VTALSDIQGRATFTPTARVNGDRAFRAARRHSRHVRALRIAIPAAVVAVIIGGFAFSAVIKPLRALSRLPVDLGSVVVSGTKIMMQQPHIAGFTRDNRRYDLTAQAAGQDVTKPDLVELQGIHATMEMQDQAVFDTTAQNGLYNSKSEQLTLTNHIVVTSSNGYEALLSEALLDIRGNKITSEKPVYVKTSTATVNANRMEVLDGGDVIRFERGVNVELIASAAPRLEARGR